MDFTVWVRHFERNVAEQRALEAQLDRPRRVPPRRTHAGGPSCARSSASSWARAATASTCWPKPTRRRRAVHARAGAVRRRGTAARRPVRPGAGPPGRSIAARHWSDAVFTAAAPGVRAAHRAGAVPGRRGGGLRRTSPPWPTGAPDPVLRAIGRRLEHDERDHLRFQVDRLAPAYADSPRVLRAAVRAALLTIGLGAAVVLATDHRAALRACGQARLATPGERSGACATTRAVATRRPAAPRPGCLRPTRPSNRRRWRVSRCRRRRVGDDEHRGAAFLAHHAVVGVPVVVGAAGAR